MKKVKDYPKIRQIKKHRNTVYIHINIGNIYTWDINDIKLIIEGDIDNFVHYNDNIFYQLRERHNDVFVHFEEKEKLVLSTDNENVAISNSCLINSKLSVSITKSGDFIPCGIFLIDSDLKVERLDKPYRFDIKVNNKYFNYNRNEVFAYSDNLKKVYTINTNNFGRNIAKHPKTGAVLWDKPNEIKERILGDYKNVYVPLTGGQLLAINVETGEKEWMWEHNRNGTHQGHKEFIYKQDGLSIYEINAKDGTLNRKKDFNSDKLVDKLHASGPLWVYEDVIIVCDVLYGKVCMLDRTTFDVLEFFSIGNNIINSENSIIWNENKLYVLDIENTLHIFEKE